MTRVHKVDKRNQPRFPSLPRHRAPQFTWDQIKTEVEMMLKREGLDGTAPVHFPTNCGRKLIDRIYVGGDSEPEVVVISLRERKDDED